MLAGIKETPDRSRRGSTRSGRPGEMATAEPLHPSDIDGVTDEYRSFLKTWGTHCGAPLSVFQGHLNCLVQAELRAAGEDVVQYAQEIAQKHARHWKAMNRLTNDLIAFLGEHDCVTAGHVGEGCP